MFTHVMVGAADVPASRRFYDAVLGALGHSAGSPSDGRVYWATPTGLFLIGTPINGEPACRANGGTIGFAAKSPEQADAWHAAGVASGGSSCEDPPGWREGLAGRIYLAYLRDPSGNKICAVHRPQPA